MALFKVSRVDFTPVLAASKFDVTKPTPAHLEVALKEKLSKDMFDLDSTIQEIASIKAAGSVADKAAGSVVDQAQDLLTAAYQKAYKTNKVTLLLTSGYLPTTGGVH